MLSCSNLVVVGFPVSDPRPVPSHQKASFTGFVLGGTGTAAQPKPNN